MFLLVSLSEAFCVHSHCLVVYCYAVTQSILLSCSWCVILLAPIFSTVFGWIKTRSGGLKFGSGFVSYETRALTFSWLIILACSPDLISVLRTLFVFAGPSGVEGICSNGQDIQTLLLYLPWHWNIGRIFDAACRRSTRNRPLPHKTLFVILAWPPTCDLIGQNVKKCLGWFFMGFFYITLINVPLEGLL